MREILFRGKRIDNGEWVEGAFLNDRDGAFYICPAVSDITYGDNGNRRRIGCWYKVDPATVGQYTGLTDKNGKRIFEGDVVREVWGESVYYKKLAVSMDSERCGWFPFACGDGCGCCEDEVLEPTYAEVIGNIHDNPELLKEG